ncbi:MAG: hypothetical protein ACHQ2Y_10270, partial [Candidatus Lutacidiplasmatales archaeon]
PSKPLAATAAAQAQTPAPRSAPGASAPSSRPATSAGAPTPEPAAAAMKACSNCSKEIPPDYLVCPFCGAVTQ